MLIDEGNVRKFRLKEILRRKTNPSQNLAFCDGNRVLLQKAIFFATESQFCKFAGFFPLKDLFFFFCDEIEIRRNLRRNYNPSQIGGLFPARKTFSFQFCDGIEIRRNLQQIFFSVANQRAFSCQKNIFFFSFATDFIFRRKFGGFFPLKGLFFFGVLRRN